MNTGRMFKKILVANRGEIAVRVIRTCMELGIKTVAVYSKADKGALHTQLADESICIGSGPGQDSYLNMERLITVAKETKADAIHPGYGFLSENVEFVRVCADNEITFIGPSVDAMSKMGAKDIALETVKRNGVPTVSGSNGIVPTKDDAEQVAKEIGFPVMVKAVAGGGGKGMRLAQEENELERAFEQARSEAEKSFGNPDVFIEQYIRNPRHVEVQVLADQHGNVVHFGERDCSIQRRHQKLVEEAPSPAVSKELRKKIGDSAVGAAKSVDYEGVGTVEFLMDQDGEFYFMEMNTRIQVEHPVTEMITNVDLVKEQIRVAAGEALGYDQEDIEMSGWAIECRVNAEDPVNAFQPTPGTIQSFMVPGGYHVRVDTGVFSGAVIPPYYDSMVAKIIVKGASREEAIMRMKRALQETEIKGVATTIPFQLQLFDDPRFHNSDYDIHFIEEHGEELIKALEEKGDQIG